MTVWMDKTANGRDCIHTNSEEVGAGKRTNALLADCILMRPSDGAFTIAEPTSLPCLSPAQVEMIKYFLAEKGMSKPNLFAGQPARAAKKTDTADEKEVAT